MHANLQSDINLLHWPSRLYATYAGNNVKCKHGQSNKNLKDQGTRLDNYATVNEDTLSQNTNSESKAD